MLDLKPFRSRIIATHVIAGREAKMAELPPALHPDLREALAQQGLAQLFSHQREMFDAAGRGDNVVITTGTASGKTLGFLLPIVQRILLEPASRALLLYPTKALGADQLRGILDLIEPFGERRVQAGLYDGDTPPVERTRVRESCHLILTNPDMLNAGWLPHHGRKGFTHIFRNVRYIVIDEMHVYRGAFGSHFANLMRRLVRLCRFYGSAPQFLCSSATLANARELAELLCDQPFTHVDRDGSPSAAKTIHFWQPPIVANDFRRGVVAEMATLLPELVTSRQRTIAFCRSRKETEVVLKETRDRLRSVAGGHDESDRIAGYRGGYTPEERREVEQSLLSGRLAAVVSTNALELGIDIGGLEVVVQGGFPGTRASFWQQVGRAGRRGREAHAIVILRQSPIDQYIGANPEWLVNARAEHAVVDRDNLLIQLAHVRAAATELPLTIDDAATFPDLAEIVAVLEKAGELRQSYGAYHWTGNAHPAGDFSLRNLDGDRFKIVNRSTGMTLTEMDRPQTYHEAHVRAVYLHDSQQYLVEKLDLENHQVIVLPVEQNYYTEPDIRFKIDVLRVIEAKTCGRVQVRFGDVRVDETTVGYKMLEFHNHQNLGYEVLPEPLVLTRETEAVWIELPRDVLAVLGAAGTDYVAGMVHGLVCVARMRTMAEGGDLGGTSFHAPDEDSGSAHNAIILHDYHPGGMGYAAKSFELMDEVILAAQSLVAGCGCREGCPACTGDVTLERDVIAWALASLTGTCAPPKGWAAPAITTEPVAPRELVPYAEIEAAWPRLRAEWGGSHEPGARFLRQIERVRRAGDKLSLEVRTPAMAEWLAIEANERRMRDLLSARVAVPRAFRLDFRFAESGAEAALGTSDKLRRRYDDLIG
jgi:DEAD/DEAH box helicase domain-containing protein